MRTIIRYFQVFFCSLAGMASTAFGQGVESGLKTIYFNSDYALTTHKSELVESNDTGSSLRYAVGFNVGTQKELGIVLQTESSAISFLLNDTAVSLLYRDTRITYRLGYFYLGAVSAYAEASATGADGTEMFSGRGTGFGYTAGFFYPVGKSLIQVDATSAAISDFLNKDEAVTVAMGSRMDIDISGHIPVSRRYFTLDLGYRQRTQPLTYQSTAYTETMQKTYIGFSMGTDM
ncbi:MAG: hypothetical protein RIQ81_1668 [Pseudomonadota bacterium]|jgi:hypothetical protein